MNRIDKGVGGILECGNYSLGFGEKEYVLVGMVGVKGNK